MLDVINGLYIFGELSVVKSIACSHFVLFIDVDVESPHYLSMRSISIGLGLLHVCHVCISHS